jgi:phage gp36-like protein
MTSATLIFQSPYPTLVSLTSLIRTDTQAQVPGTLTGFGSAWTISVTEPILGLTYQYQVQIDYPNGSTDTPPPGQIIGTPLYALANQYANVAQFYTLYDQRVMKVLSGDQNTEQGVAANIQFLLDMQSSEFDMVINGLYVTPLIAPIPLIVTKFVCCTTAIRMYGRRNDRPKQIDSDEQWAKEWLDKVLSTAMLLPGQSLTSNAYPALTDSDFFHGRSRFDNTFLTPSPRAPQSANPGYPPGTGPNYP